MSVYKRNKIKQNTVKLQLTNTVIKQEEAVNSSFQRGSEVQNCISLPQHERFPSVL